MKNIEYLAKYLAEPIRKYVDKIASPILEKIKEIESKKINIQEIIDQIPLPKDGVDGKSGINGKDGKSFIDQLPEIGFPSKEEFIKSLKGRDGSNGTNGKDGVNGINGKSFLEQLPELGFANKKEFLMSLRGADGKNGTNGTNGINGKSFIEQLPELGFTNKKSFIESLRGVDGKDGANGINGSNGINGINGKDALELEILPSIDESKQYDRGTYAKHQNGLWRSFEKTNGMRGWECIVAGIDSIEIEQTDDRKFSLKMTTSDGNKINKEFFMPIMVYRGVYKQGTKYEKGDTVTWGGSLWHCNQSTEVKPDDVENKHWTLAAKRGRDAK